VLNRLIGMSQINNQPRDFEFVFTMVLNLFFFDGKFLATKLHFAFSACRDGSQNDVNGDENKLAFLYANVLGSTQS